jgi:hypothetical protein
VTNDEVLHTAKKDRKILHTKRRRKPNCLLKHVVEVKKRGIEVAGRRGRPKQLLDNLRDMRVYWKLKKETLDRTLWRTRFARNNGLVAKLRDDWTP